MRIKGMCYLCMRDKSMKFSNSCFQKPLTGRFSPSETLTKSGLTTSRRTTNPKQSGRLVEGQTNTGGLTSDLLSSSPTSFFTLLVDAFCPRFWGYQSLSSTLTFSLFPIRSSRRLSILLDMLAHFLDYLLSNLCTFLGCAIAVIQIVDL